MFTKGALEEILKVCTKVKYNGQIKPITSELIKEVEQKAKEYAVQGMQVIALASKREYRGVNVFNVSDENDMTFIGFVAFLDPAKKDVKETLNKLKEIGVTTKILTGDNPYATGNICNLVGIDNTKILIGTDIDQMTDEELSKQVEEVQDFLYDISQIAIPYDDVDKEFLEKPKKWSTKGISKFMNVMGITSSIIDVIAFLGFWFLFGYNAGKETFFQTAWFVECLISETMIIHYVRTAKKPFIESRANKWLTLGTIGTIVGTILTPIILHNIPSFHFEILPLSYYGFVIILLAIYSILVEIIKKKYIKKYGEWL